MTSTFVFITTRTAGAAASEPTLTPLTLGDPDLTALYAYWATKCEGRAMPRRADINPREIPSLLPDIFLMEIHHPLRFCFRLVGSMICKRWNENTTGKWLDELDFGVGKAMVMEQYATVARTGAPRCDIKEFVGHNGRYLHYRRLLLPLSEDGTKPNMLLGLQKAIGIDGFNVPPKWI
jgi:hypothetical protein